MPKEVTLKLSEEHADLILEVVDLHKQIFRREVATKDLIATALTAGLLRDRATLRRTQALLKRIGA